jgi:hypothetical protein
MRRNIVCYARNAAGRDGRGSSDKRLHGVGSMYIDAGMSGINAHQSLSIPSIGAWMLIDADSCPTCLHQPTCMHIEAPATTQQLVGVKRRCGEQAHEGKGLGACDTRCKSVVYQAGWVNIGEYCLFV